MKITCAIIYLAFFCFASAQEKMNELIRFHNLTIDRELTMIEMKKEINRLLVETGRTEKYNIVG